MPGGSRNSSDRISPGLDRGGDVLVAATDTLLDFELAGPLRFAADRLATAPHPPMIK